MNKYIGHPLQLYGVEEMRLVGGKGDGMRILNVRNNKGLEFVVSLDRCGDIVKLNLKGDNFAYFAPCGYVSPKYYDNKGAGFLKSFTAGFFTTCGLTAVGSPCTDDGEELPLHGTISNTPCENAAHWIENDEIHIKLLVRDAALFANKFILEREYICPINENVIHMTDKIKNIGAEQSPLEVLYHCNMGYPLLSEKSVVYVPSTEVLPRNEHAKEGIEDCLKMEKPQNGYEEKCYYHTMSGEPIVTIYNPDINKGLNIKYDKTLNIARLTKDYTDLDEFYVSVLIDQEREAPAVCFRNGVYYMVTSGCTGWNYNSALFATSPHLLGKWKLIDNPCEGPGYRETFKGQSTYIFSINDRDYIMFDHWKPNDLKNSGYSILPITYDEKNNMTITWVDEWNGIT